MDDHNIRFDRDKFCAVVHYICSKCPDELGNVKLHKIMYFADMLHFMAMGRPLTGVDYLKQSFGPVARHLTQTLKKLEADGLIRIETQDYFGFEKKRYVSLASPSFKFSNLEVQLLEDVIEFVRGHSARAISELSHDAAWKAADAGERIPYAAAYGLQAGEISEDDQAWALAEARKIRPLIEAERCERGIF
ncbi:MAG: Panacea domain-containing protein [Amphiplicatus sp.]